MKKRIKVREVKVIAKARKPTVSAVWFSYPSVYPIGNHLPKYGITHREALGKFPRNLLFIQG